MAWSYERVKRRRIHLEDEHIEGETRCRKGSAMISREFVYKYERSEDVCPDCRSGQKAMF